MNPEIAWATLLQHEVEIQGGVLALCCCRRIGIRLAVSVPHFKSVDTCINRSHQQRSQRISPPPPEERIKEQPAEEDGRLVSRMGMIT